MLPRFYPILDVDAAQRCGCDAVFAAQEILNAGAKILQFRHKGFFSRATLADLEGIQQLCARAGAIFVVNDRADIAAMLGASLHLGQQDLRPSEVRSMMGDAMIGFSTHNQTQMREALSQPADYLAFGPIFPTGSKQNPDPVVGLDALREVRALTAKPLVAIGGITRSNARGVLDAGADSVAVIGDLFTPGVSIRDCAAEWIALLAD